MGDADTEGSAARRYHHEYSQAARAPSTAVTNNSETRIQTQKRQNREHRGPEPYPYADWHQESGRCTEDGARLKEGIRIKPELPPGRKALGS